jgi:multiple sugar transport system substrate-binding protein
VKQSKKWIVILTTVVTICLAASGFAQVRIVWSNPDLVSWQPTYQRLAEAFMERNPDIHVEVLNIPQSGYLDRLITSIAAGTAPDVFTWFFASEAAERGFYEDLTPYIERDGLNPEELWFPIAQQRAMYQGRFYSVPRDAVYVTFAYNRGIFEAAGVEPPTDDWTPEDMKTMLRDLVDYGNNVFGMSWGGVDLLLWHPFAYTLGANVVDETGRQVLGHLDSPETIEALRFVLDLEAENLTLPEFAAQQFAAGGSDIFFSTGQLALGTIEWGAEAFLDLDFDWGTVQPPLAPGVERMSWGDSVQYYMWSGSQHKEAVWELLKFLSGPEAGQIVAEIGTWMPPNPSVWLEMGWDDHPVFGGPWQQAQFPTMVPNYLRSEYFFDAVYPHLTNIQTRYIELGERPLEDIVRDEAEQAQSELDRTYRRR